MLYYKMFGINVATGEMISSVSTSTWIGWIDHFYHQYVHTDGIHLKYFWRDQDQIDSQYIKWGNNTSAILAVQNDELPLSFDQSLSILESFQRYPIIKAYTIGNEMDAFTSPEQFSNTVLSSMQVFYRARQQLNINVPISTPLTMQIFGWESMTLNPLWKSVLLDLLEFQNRSGSPFMINIYPYLSWYNHQNLYSFEESMTELLQNKINWIRNCIDSLGYSRVQIWITETGWPTDGNFAATTENAKRYFDHIRFIESNLEIPIYWFELIDEGKKPGTIDEHYYGLFREDGQCKICS